MIDAALMALCATLAIALITWTVSVVKRDASIVDAVWSLMILGCGVVYAAALPQRGQLATWMLALAALWALRLSIYIAWRNWGEPEDRRYRAIRERNQPGFAAEEPLPRVRLAGAARLDRVRAAARRAGCGPCRRGRPGARGVRHRVRDASPTGRWRAFAPRAPGAQRVLDSGLWRYSRHPNYFGEFCVWWGFGLAAASAGAWWALVSPLLMTLLLLRVSGVTLLEKDLSTRKPAYREYMQRTNAFFPGPPRVSS